MSDGCTGNKPNCGDQDPCDPCAQTADPNACATPTRKTYCDGDTKNNVWMEHVDPDASGICLLDTMTECQVIYTLERDARARQDLLRVTTDPRLLELARTVTPLATSEFADDLQSSINKNAESIPFFTVFKGQPPFAQ